MTTTKLIKGSSGHYSVQVGERIVGDVQLHDDWQGKGWMVVVESRLAHAWPEGPIFPRRRDAVDALVNDRIVL